MQMCYRAAKRFDRTVLACCRAPAVALLRASTGHFVSQQMLASVAHNRSCLVRGLRQQAIPAVGNSRSVLPVLGFRREFDRKQSSSIANKAAPKRDFLEARQISLYELFDGNAFLLDVPEYQRPYAWRAKQVQELLADLQAAYWAGQEYFLGSIVTTRQGDAPGEPFWVIDGQQRLTTLLMLLGYLRAWASSQPGLSSLAERVEHMLHIQADPLNPQAQARYRLLLKRSEQQFFIDNFITSYLPVRYHLSTQLDGPANASGEYHEAAHSMQHQQQRLDSSSSSGYSGTSPAAATDSNGVNNITASNAPRSIHQQQSNYSVPIANETWWRLYCAGDVLACSLAHAMRDGLNLQDFMHHVLKNCMVVVMTARDESTSFKVFSTLNGRGVDLALIDKLKPELLQVLPPELRQSYADRWAVLESALGRPSFHALFDHYITIEQAAETLQPGRYISNHNGSTRSSIAKHSSLHARQQNGASSNGNTAASTAAYIPPGSTLMAHNANSKQSFTSAAAVNSDSSGHVPSNTAAAAGNSSSHTGPLTSSRWDVLIHLSGVPDAERVLDLILEYGQRLLQIRANDWSGLAAEGGTAPGIAAELSDACFYINLLRDDAWQPWTLEFFYRSADDAKRAAFLRGAEVLQLYCELKQDEAFKQERWLAVGSELLQQPFYSDQVLAALALSPDECDDFIKLLDARELAASADEGLLVHLLLRADSISRKHTDWRRLKVEKIMPSYPPEGSQWRKQKLLLPVLEQNTAASSTSGSSGFGLFNPLRGRSPGSTRGGSGGSSGSSNSSSSSSRASRGSRSTTVSSSGGSSSTMMSAATIPAGTAVTEPISAASISQVGGSSGTGSSSHVPARMREVRYWHEITRNHWHNRLGNLVLLQPSGQELSAAGHLSADLSIKLAHYAACGGDEQFPDFTGGLVNGRYTRDLFSPEECRQRHADVISRLIAAFGLNHTGGL